MAAYAIQFRRGTTTQHNSFTGLLGEVTVDTDKKTLVVHDGSTTGGFPLAREGANLSSAEGSFSSNVLIGGALEVTSTSVFNDDVGITGDLAMTGHIIPSANITYDLGSPTMMWKDIYVGPGSLYVNGKKVIEDNAGTIQITTDINQNLKVETTGTGVLQLSSAGGISINGEVNALTGDLNFGDHLNMNSNLVKNVGSPVSAADAANKSYVDTKISTELNSGALSIDATNADFSGAVTIGGNLTVTGTVTTVSSETIELADNILLLNSNALGNASQNAGIEVERGDDLNVQFLWDETNNRWTAGAEDIRANTFIGDVTGDVTGNVTGTVSSLSNHTTDNLDEGSNLYWTTARGDANFATNLIASDTDDLAEGTNLYWTTARGTAMFDTRLAAKSTSNLAEGTNLYFTDTRVRAAISVSGDLSYNATTGVISTQGLASSTTSELAEGSNLYFTDARAQAAVATNVATAKSEAIASAQSYADQAEIDAVASAEAKDAARAATAVAYADQAEADAIASAEAKDAVRANAASADATAKADQAEADAIASAEAKDATRANAASADATAKANAAQAAAEATASADATTKADAAEAAAISAAATTSASNNANTLAAAAADATSKANAAQATASADATAKVLVETTARESADATLTSDLATEKGRIDAIMAASSSDADTFAEVVALVNSVDTTNDNGLAAEITARTNADTALSGRLATVEGTGAGSTSAALTEAKAYADQAEADAIASAEAKDATRATEAASDATAKANAALASAQSYADSAEADAIASAEAKDAVRATAAATDATTKADQAEADAIASAEAKDAVRATAASADATAKANAALSSAQSYADQAEADAIASAETKDVARALTASNDRAAIRSEFAAADTTLQSNIDAEKGRIDAIMSASTSDADTFAEIVSLVNSVDTTNDNGLAAEISARTNADAALDTRLDVVEGTGAGSVAKALVDAKAYADQAEADAVSTASADATSKANSAEADAIASAEAKDVVRATAATAYTDARETAITSAYTSAISTAVAGKDNTDEITEGSSNLYFTDARADARVANATGSNLNLGNKSTSDLSEGSNQYFTNARAVAAVEASLTHFHSADQTVTAASSVANATASVSFTFSELVGADHYAVYLNRMLLRPGEFTVSGGSTNNLTISTGILAEDDELEVVGFSI